ncbi:MULTISPECIES: hypothetical protein [unclassified Rhizobium]|uniref:hypothetical protein n=1 Tax=unclassified Rhizobium TaxID=2613769 RepID=UPI001781408D|nr:MULTISPECIES: hypothetical protein [unclassified Rhizobium]MBD8688226.1 hypothetical protein [Rhizobium sp. CFBP 13644]MBD8692681.1 hypothetical protein [Rhizobium sp. CFBP 13717]
MSLSAEENKVLVRYCGIFAVDQTHIADNRKHAFGILGAMYAYPSVRSQSDRHKLRDATLQETARVWGQDSLFFADVIRIVSLSMHQAEYYVRRHKSNDELIEEFGYQLIAVIVLEVIGVGGLGGAVRGSFNAGAAKAISENSLRAGLEAAKRRMLLGAGSAVLEAAAIRWGAALGIWAAAFVAALLIAHEVMVSNLEEIRSEITERHGKGEASDEELEKVQNTSFLDIINRGLEPYW